MTKYLLDGFNNILKTPSIYRRVNEQNSGRTVLPELYSISFGTFTVYIPTQSTSMTLPTI